MSMFNLAKSVFLATIACLALSIPASAAPEPILPVAPKSQQAAEPLTDETLLQMLRGLGHEPYETGKFDDGGKFYWVKVTGSTNYPAQFSLSSDKTVMWISVYVAELTAGDAPAAQLRKLMEVNTKGRFLISGNQLYYQYPIDNCAVTPMVLRAGIDIVTRTLTTTAPLWNISTWTKEGKDVAESHQKFVAARAKVATAMTELSTAFRPITEGKELDGAKLDRAYEDYCQAIREFADAMAGWAVPNSPAAKELFEAYKQWFGFYEKVLAEEMVEVIRVAKDTGMTPAQRLAKAQEIMGTFGEREKATRQAVEDAFAKFVKHHKLS